MLFLLIHMTINFLDCSSEIGVAGAWTEYVKMLPEDVLVPTAWTETQRKFLNGTSLEVGFISSKCTGSFLHGLLKLT
jgi:hypothetical protein